MEHEVRTKSFKFTVTNVGTKDDQNYFEVFIFLEMLQSKQLTSTKDMRRMCV